MIHVEPNRWGCLKCDVALAIWHRLVDYRLAWLILGVLDDKVFLVLGLVQLQIFLQNDHVARFVVIWQLVSNHGLIRLKRFISSISSKLCN
jgi:hypothetical protein